ncbi:hypothetical protein BDQ12DRAFT_360147 [Crucibulum laeve]|uniref:C2H2-type domain-containing protein n=1 Tax=Crucibulum laeve TaxID=68775 RepID=A0A5C3LPF6_9AGAR|nr:hypothetical protein BDQ12DRAFT_360147 [Crucibulum laeve]
MSDFDNSTSSVYRPPLTDSDAVASLLSLSLPANAAPIPIAPAGAAPTPYNELSGHSPASTTISTSVGASVKAHRRLASTGKTRRRLSDAREAATRPSPAALQTPTAALSLASLSLSSSPPSHAGAHVSSSLTGASKALAPASTASLSSPFNDESNISQQSNGDSDAAGAISNSNGRHGKKRGMDHKCECCSKIYRHPSCLIKHRWEHTTHWREASKFVLSKHQQVQLLEAAAILSHLDPSATGGASLPEDRSLWPSFLSGGSLPPPEAPMPAGPPSAVSVASPSNGIAVPVPTTATSTSSLSTSPYPTHPTSSSVPANFKRSSSTGPRLHDYSLGSAGGLTQLRPGLVGVPTGTTGVMVGSNGATGVVVNHNASKPVPVPISNSNGAPQSSFAGYRSASNSSWTSNGVSSSYQSATSNSYAPSSERGGWSLPRSSLRGGSGFSASLESRSRSTSRSDDEAEEDDGISVDNNNVAVHEDDSTQYGRYAGYGFASRRVWKRESDELDLEEDRQLPGRGFALGRGGFSVREEDEDDEDAAVVAKGRQRTEEWDGMDMEMEMDMD